MIFKKVFFCISISLMAYNGQAQDSLQVQKKALKEEVTQSVISDSIAKVAVPVKKQDSLSGIITSGKAMDASTNKALNIEIEAYPKSDKSIDLISIDDYDKDWINELYNNSLFDTIYRDVSDLKYNAVYYPELPTDTLKARLKRLNARTPFNISYNPTLESVIKNWLKNRHQSMERLMGLSKFYFPLFEQEFDAKNIPLELKYLAIVESALKPKARSRVGATGIWQFMYTTGKMYGLDVTSYVDERSDIAKSTKAAAEYLARLNKIFKDWDLALAAYNSGPGNVSKAIRRSGGYRNYWGIRKNLPRETAGYVPAFLATMYIFEYAEEHGFLQHKPRYNYVQTDTINVKQAITLKQVEAKTGVPLETLQFLNPQYKLDIIPLDTENNNTLRLPLEAVGNFVNNEAAIYEEVKEVNKNIKAPVVLSTEIRYRVKQGDYLGKIARKYGVRVSQIKKWNRLRSNALKIGQRLTIYSRRGMSSVRAKSSKKKLKKGVSYKVKSGDSLWDIAQKYDGVSVQNLKDWNNLKSNSLKVGMILKTSK